MSIDIDVSSPFSVLVITLKLNIHNTLNNTSVSDEREDLENIFIKTNKVSVSIIDEITSEARIGANKSFLVKKKIGVIRNT